MITQLIITFFSWIVMVYISINLIGMLVRGLVLVADIENILSESNENIKNVTNEFYNRTTEQKVNIFSVVLIFVYLGILFFFWDIGVVVIAIILMLAKIPDLLWEIKHGRQNVKNMPAIYHLTTLIYFAALPGLWYVLYRL